MDLSIIVPVYNGSKYIKECLDSITFYSNELDYEILIIDDGSTDDSVSLCESYPSKNIRLIKNFNHGVSYSRNCGISAASGNYVMFVDIDDKLLKGWSSIVKDAIKSGSEIVFFSDRYRVEHINKVDIVNALCGTKVNVLLPWLSAPWSKIFKRSFLNENFIRFDELIINGEDLIFNLRSIVSCDSFSFSSKSIYTYRIVATSATHTFNDRFFDSNIRFLQRLEQELNRFKLSDEIINNYVSHSFVNSIYLLVYRISKIEKAVLRKDKIKYFCNRKELKDLFNKYEATFSNSFDRILMYELIKRCFYETALYLMKFRNLIFEKNKSISSWEKI